MNKVVYVTGFGEFHGVKENPSMKIVEELRSKQFCVDGHSVVFEVLEVSVEYCRDFISKLDFDNNCYIFVHIGVDSNGTAIKLEQCAYNNMNFRVPDERGYQPQLTQINTDSDVDTPLHSELSLPAICGNVNGTIAQCSRPGDIDITLSTDPGRFLCNYIYYNSLLLQQSHNRPLNAVFVHVPTLATLPFENQVSAIENIVKEIVATAK